MKEHIEQNHDISDNDDHDHTHGHNISEVDCTMNAIRALQHGTDYVATLQDDEIIGAELMKRFATQVIEKTKEAIR